MSALFVRGSRALGVRLHQWHAGQGDPVYAVGSCFYAGRRVPPELVEGALRNLRASRNPRLPTPDARHLEHTIYQLEQALARAGRGSATP